MENCGSFKGFDFIYIYIYRIYRLLTCTQIKIRVRYLVLDLIYTFNKLLFIIKKKHLTNEINKKNNIKIKKNPIIVIKKKKKKKRKVHYDVRK